MQNQVIDSRDQEGDNTPDVDMSGFEQHVVIFDQIHVHQIPDLSRSPGRLIVGRHLPKQQFLQPLQYHRWLQNNQHLFR